MFNSTDIELTDFNGATTDPTATAAGANACGSDPATADTSFSVTLSSNLRAGKTYTVTLTPEADELQDVSGNDLASPSAASFTTSAADTTAPTLTDTRATANVVTTNFSDVGDKFTITFSEEMNATTATDTISLQDADGSGGLITCGTNATCTFNTAGTTNTGDTSARSRALALADEGVRADPNNPRAHLTRVIARQAAGDLAEALGSAERALALDPGSINPRIYATVIQLRVANRRTADAIERSGASRSVSSVVPCSPCLASSSPVRSPHRDSGTKRLPSSTRRSPSRRTSARRSNCGTRFARAGPRRRRPAYRESVRALVTGGAGFIGSHLVRRLAADGAEVRVVDDFSTGDRRNLKGTDVEIVAADLVTANLAPLVAGREMIFHLAAVPSVPRSVRDPLRSHEAAATATLRLLIASRDASVARFVNSSSSSVYGDIALPPMRESMPTAPRSPYAVAKLAAEGYVRVFAQLYGMSTVSLRYFNVFGPRQSPDSAYAAAIPRFIKAYRDREPPIVHGDGRQSRDFTFVDNVVEANLLAARAPGLTGESLNIAAGEPRSVLDVLDAIATFFGYRVSPSFAPARQGDIRDSHADLELARRMLGYEPRVDFANGLRQTAQWLCASEEA